MIIDKVKFKYPLLQTYSRTSLSVSLLIRLPNRISAPNMGKTFYQHYDNRKV